MVANAKHWVNNNQETNRTTDTAVVDERARFEMYYPPFEGAVKAGVGSIMCSYNRINGVDIYCGSTMSECNCQNGCYSYDASVCGEPSHGEGIRFSLSEEGAGWQRMPGQPHTSQRELGSRDKVS